MICVYVCVHVHLTAWIEGGVITLLKRSVSGVVSNRFILTDFDVKVVVIHPFDSRA